MLFLSRKLSLCYVFMSFCPVFVLVKSSEINTKKKERNHFRNQWILQKKNWLWKMRWQKYYKLVKYLHPESKKKKKKHPQNISNYILTACSSTTCVVSFCWLELLFFFCFFATVFINFTKMYYFFFPKFALFTTFYHRLIAQKPHTVLLSQTQHNLALSWSHQVSLMRATIAGIVSKQVLQFG